MSVLALNKKASFEYHLLERYEAGLVLTGSEVKSLRQGKSSLQEAYVTERNGEVFLLNFTIPLYHRSNAYTSASHDPKSPKKLLLHKREIKKIAGGLTRKGLTMVPTKLYISKKGLIKIEVALGKGKNLVDKRETIKQREWKRQKQRQSVTNL